jgi:hypothetical protein
LGPFVLNVLTKAFLNADIKKRSPARYTLPIVERGSTAEYVEMEAAIQAACISETSMIRRCLVNQ